MNASMRLRIEHDPIPREFYDIIVSLKERLEEFEVSESDTDIILDKVELLIASALRRAEEEPDEDADSDDEENESDDEEETRKG